MKFADDIKASSDKGGLPCLPEVSWGNVPVDAIGTCLTRSARVKGLRGHEASLLISFSDVDALDGGCDHSLIAGEKAPDAWARLLVVEQTERVARNGTLVLDMAKSAEHA